MSPKYPQQPAPSRRTVRERARLAGIAQRAERERLPPEDPRLKVTLPQIRFLDVEVAAKAEAAP
jgi:hypothetical protein